MPPKEEVVAPLRSSPGAPETTKQDGQEDQFQQVRQLVKHALEAPTPEQFAEFFAFTTRFRRLSVWNARMAYIQRPGARVIASEYEWATVKRYVQPDGVPIIILWPFSPIRFVYELADTGPPVDRDSLNDPFAAQGVFNPIFLSRLASNLKQQKSFRIRIEPRRQGFSYAGSAAAQGVLPIIPSLAEPSADGNLIGTFAQQNAKSDVQQAIKKASGIEDVIPEYRVTVNDRLEPMERFVTIAHELAHIFCGHLGECRSHSNKDEESGWPDRTKLGKNEREVEAEAVAYLVASRAGIVTGSAAYLRDYARRADINKVDLDLIVRAAARIERLGKIHYGSMTFKGADAAASQRQL